MALKISPVKAKTENRIMSSSEASSQPLIQSIVQRDNLKKGRKYLKRHKYPEHLRNSNKIVS